MCMHACSLGGVYMHACMQSRTCVAALPCVPPTGGDRLHAYLAATNCLPALHHLHACTSSMHACPPPPPCMHAGGMRAACCPAAMHAAPPPSSSSIPGRMHARMCRPRCTTAGQSSGGVAAVTRCAGGWVRRCGSTNNQNLSSLASTAESCCIII